MSASLEERIRQLESRLAQQTANVIAPRETWLVEARPKPSTSWPTDSTTRFFWGILKEWSYDPTDTTPSLTESYLGKTSDATKPGWVRFYSPFFVFEGMDLEIRQSRDYPDNWFVSRMPGDLLAWIPSGGIAARAGITMTEATVDIYTNTDDEVEPLLDASASQVSGPVFNIYPEDIDGCRFAPLRLTYGGDWYPVGWGCSAETSGSPCAAPT